MHDFVIDNAVVVDGSGALPIRTASPLRMAAFVDPGNSSARLQRADRPAERIQSARPRPSRLRGVSKPRTLATRPVLPLVLIGSDEVQRY